MINAIVEKDGKDVILKFYARYAEEMLGAYIRKEVQTEINKLVKKMAKTIVKKMLINELKKLK